MRLGHDARGERILRRREVPYVVEALIMRAGARSFGEHPVRIEGGEGDLVDVHAVRGRGEGGLQILGTAAARERGRDPVSSWRHVRGAVDPCIRGRSLRGDARRLLDDLDVGAGYDGAAGIFYDAGDHPAPALRCRGIHGAQAPRNQKRGREKNYGASIVPQA